MSPDKLLPTFRIAQCQTGRVGGKARDMSCEEGVALRSRD